MKKSSKFVTECSDQDMVSIIAAEVMGPQQAPLPVGTSQQSELLKKRMSQYIGMLRGMQLWYHSAHHVTRGTGFFGDHADLYGTLYNALGEDFDKAVEKALGLTNDEELANPSKITEMALQVIHKFPSPPSLSALALASTALEIEKAHNELVTVLFHELEQAGCLTLGLDDMLMATVNDHEGYVYKLQQRVKSELED